MTGHSRNDRGFTLIEVLVALAIVVVGLAALATTANQSARTTTYLRDKTLAQWIALNRITEARVSGATATEDVAEGDLEYGGRRWRWELERIATPVEGIIRLEARVSLEDAREGSWVGQATGFMGDAISPPSAGAPLDWTGQASARPGGNPGGGPDGGRTPQEPEPPQTPPGGGEPQQ